MFSPGTSPCFVDSTFYPFEFFFLCSLWFSILSLHFLSNFSCLDIVPSVGTPPVTHSVNKDQKQSILEVPSDPSTEGVPSGPSTEDVPSKPAKDDNLSATMKSEQKLGSPPLGGRKESSSEETKDGNDKKLITSNKKG